MLIVTAAFSSQMKRKPSFYLRVCEREAVLTAEAVRASVRICAHVRSRVQRRGTAERIGLLSAQSGHRTMVQNDQESGHGSTGLLACPFARTFAHTFARSTLLIYSLAHLLSSSWESE